MKHLKRFNENKKDLGLGLKWDNSEYVFNNSFEKVKLMFPDDLAHKLNVPLEIAELIQLCLSQATDVSIDRARIKYLDRMKNRKR